MQQTDESSPAVPTWPALVASGLALLALLAIATQVVNEVVVPPLIGSAVLLSAAAIFVLRRRGSLWLRVGAALSLLFLALNAPYLIEDTAHPESVAGFATSTLVLIVSLMTLVAGAAGSLRPARAGARLVAATAAFVALAGIVPAAVAARTAEDDVALPADTELIAADGDFSGPVEVGAAGALFVRNDDRYRHTLVIEHTDVKVELPAFGGRRVPINLEPGTYRYYCDVPGHDMEGSLVVTGPASGAALPTTDSTQEETTMKRTAVNPWPWSIELGFNQGELIEGHTRELLLSGQSAMSADGQPQHAGDMAAQITMSLDNIEAVLAEAGMDLSNVVRLNIYTTDVDETFANYGIIAERLGTAGVAPPGSLLGVARLAYPELMVELEATAVG